MYSPEITEPMKKELTSLGVIDLKTPEDVDKILKLRGSTLIIINSVCGCAAGNARPAVKLALLHHKLPSKVGTVFAGVDKEATSRVREYIKNYQPSSPSIVLFKDNNPVFMLQRSDIEGRKPEDIAMDLTNAFDRFA
ncbi:BrxA/BrxB family bacilliredoxin [Candidatus Woesearchaeota archaeon]|nr:BrxA/BrxB family bacilliredoxin [Candidatus Woesearchaeota archaeon]